MPNDQDIHAPDPPDPVPDDQDIRAPTRLLLEDRGNSPFPFSLEYECRPGPVIDVEALVELAVLPSMQCSMQFILALKKASLNEELASNAIEKIWNPPSHADPIDDPGMRFSISTYLALENTSQLAYSHVCQAARTTFSGSPGANDILTFHSVEKLIASYTGVVSVEHDMCHNTCIAFTSPFSQLEACPICNTSRWKEERLQGTHRRSKIAAQTFTMILISLQLQALYQNKDSANDMDYLHTRTMEVLQGLQETGNIPVIDDIVMGWDYLGAVLDGDIKQQDIILMVSLDGAQLYDSKESDCWMYIWIVVNLPPDKRYCKLHV
ncbi:hypothetical protein PISMIDRAFT_13953 [Pisolithus microcarpus 441]|uniref:Unplaced genomic scaffold scaffold_108, whole genome shotgun sequence n=1 Tax=Pisolithus microcarpus 441 TaxID=765257 RepID=A0A0C9YR33_9AGAM|nr:hypothetical protein PISMIDRAFT_13953 [Pisolithus microcarpus 441]